MNIDFNVDPVFSSYVLALVVTGVIMMLLASVGRTSTGLRLFNGLVGAAFFGYGIYLAFFFTGAEYFIFFKAFILPAILIFKTVVSLFSKEQEEATPAPDAVVQPAE